VVGVDAVGGDAELFEGGFLGGEVLLVGGTAGVADQGLDPTLVSPAATLVV